MYAAASPRELHGGLCCAWSASAAAPMYALIVGLRESHTCCSQELSEPAWPCLGCCWPVVSGVSCYGLAALHRPGSCVRLHCLGYAAPDAVTQPVIKGWFTEVSRLMCNLLVLTANTRMEDVRKRASCNQLVKALLHASHEFHGASNTPASRYHALAVCELAACMATASSS